MVEKENIRDLISSSTVVFIGTVFASGVQLLERVVVGRLLSPEIYGEINIGLAILSFGVTLAVLGFDQGVPRYASRFDEETAIRGAWITGLSLSLVLAIVMVVLGAATLEELHALLFARAESQFLLLLLIVSIVPVVGYKIGIAGIQGVENTRYRFYVRDLFYPICRIGLIVILLLLGFETAGVGYAYLIASIAAAIFAHYLLNRLVPLVGDYRTRFVEMAKFSAPLLVGSVALMMLLRTDTLMLGYFRSRLAGTLDIVGRLFRPGCSGPKQGGTHCSRMHELRAGVERRWHRRERRVKPVPDSQVRGRGCRGGLCTVVRSAERDRIDTAPDAVRYKPDHQPQSPHVRWLADISDPCRNGG